MGELIANMSSVAVNEMPEAVALGEEFAAEAEEDIPLQFQTFVEEAPELEALVKSIVQDIDANVDKPAVDTQFGKNIDRFIQILEKYQEQPGLLDPHLESLLCPLMSQLRLLASRLLGVAEKAIPARYHQVFRVVYFFCKVRGYKTIVKLFPHEVADLEPTFELLEGQDRGDHETWETRYVLLLWMSMIALIPFDLDTVDSTLLQGGKSAVNRIVELSQEYLSDTGKTREGAAVLLSRLLTRPDLQKGGHLVNFLHWSAGILSTASSDQIFLTTGVYNGLVEIFKVGQRAELLDKCQLIFGTVTKAGLASNSTLQRKLVVKLAQRIALTYLKPRLAPWRYERGSRSLLDNLKKHAVPGADRMGDIKPSHTQQDVQTAAEEEEQDEVGEDIEEIIEQLLNGLRDKDTIVRWSAAKGIGRLTGRLPMEFADQVVESVLELFSPRESDGAWHGGCLALAELARRGLLLPSRLPVVVPVLLKALQYDVRRGAHSVGAHVRDAACFVAWAFARAYSPEVLQGYVQEVARGLLIVALFDREVNCRRAASAAFQENVGRQGQFPHGIDILTAADYFTLGNRSNAFLDISVFVAQFPEYRYHLIGHVVDTKLRHWEKSLRQLSAKTLHNLTATDPAHVASEILPKLIPMTLSDDLNTRHGAVLAVAEALLALSQGHLELIDDSMRTKLRNLVPEIEKARLYRGRGGEIMRGAVCRFMECMALANLPLPAKTLTVHQKTIDECIKHPNQEIQLAAVQALKAFSIAYYISTDPSVGEKLVGSYLHILSTDTNPAARRGYALGLGCFPEPLLRTKALQVIDCLVTATHIEENPDARDAETRRNAVGALTAVAETLGIRDVLDRSQVNKIWDALLSSMDDYSVDRRGDVGSWVREAAMPAVEQFCYLLVRADQQEATGSEKYFTAERALSFVGKLLQQLMEKIDRVRDAAGAVFERFIRNQDPVVSNIPHRQRLESVLVPNQIINWAAPSVTFALLMPLADLPEYRPYLLTGLIISVGGLTESTVRFSSQALSDFISSLGSREDADGQLQAVADALLDIYRAYAGNERVVIPLLKTFDFLLASSMFPPERFGPPHGEFASSLLTMTQAEIRGSKDIFKIRASVPVFLGLLPFADSIRTAAVQQLLSLLCHRYPTVRKYTAEQMYVKLLVFQDVVPSEDDLFDITAILTGTQWLSDDIAGLKAERDKMYPLFGVAPLPVAARVPGTAKSSEPKKHEPRGDYGDLVKEMGY
eukprot:GILJ01004127.1.p1 GENE.GILJ01004127.1~~GILJ01004127.1.p1  ORF type:complete len:1237 (-),score=209.83 GILJ01004127.1:67-3777(-)